MAFYMMTQLDLEAGFRGQTLAKNLQAMIFYKLFSHSEHLGPMKREILGLFDVMIPYLTLKK